MNSVRKSRKMNSKENQFGCFRVEKATADQFFEAGLQ
jgi:hypothetical protein